MNLNIPKATIQTVVPQELLNSKYGKELELAISMTMKAMHLASITWLMQEDAKDTSSIGLGGVNLERNYIRVAEDGSETTITNQVIMALFGRELKRVFPDDPILCDDFTTLMTGDEEFATTTAKVLQDFGITDQEAVSPFEAALWASHCASYTEEVGDGPAPSRFWAFVPVDTTETLRKEKEYTTSLALIEDGKPVVAVMGCPCTLFDHYSRTQPMGGGVPICYAVEGLGSWTQLVVLESKDNVYQGKYRLRGKSLKLTVEEKIKRGNDKLFDALKSEQLRISMPYHPRQDVFEDAQAVASTLGSQFPRLDMINSNVKYCWLARGEADIVWYMSMGLADREAKEPLVHHAAGALIAEEAGAAVADLDGDPIKWCGRMLSENRGIVATSPGKVAIAGLVDAVKDATVKSEAALARRIEKANEILAQNRRIIESLGKYAETEEDKRGAEKVMKMAPSMYEKEKARMNEIAQDNINKEKPMFGGRTPQPGEDAFP